MGICEAKDQFEKIVSVEVFFFFLKNNHTDSIEPHTYSSYDTKLNYIKNEKQKVYERIIL